MKRMNLKLDGELQGRFLRDMEMNKRGPQGEFEYLVERALDQIEGRGSGQARELAEAIEAAR